MFEIDDRSCITGADPDGVVRVPEDASFLADYMPAPELQEIGEALIRARPELHDVAHASIRYMWRRKHGTSSGKTVLGKCQKMSGVNKAAASADYVVFVAADVVREQQMTHWQLEALIYHELNHVGVDFDDEGEPTFKVRGHDVEMFRCEVEEYGLWRPNLEEAAATFRQLSLLAAPAVSAAERLSKLQELGATVSSNARDLHTPEEVRQAVGQAIAAAGHEVIDRRVGELVQARPSPERMAEVLRQEGITVAFIDGEYVDPETGNIFDDERAAWVRREYDAIVSRRGQVVGAGHAG